MKQWKARLYVSLLLCSAACGSRTFGQQSGFAAAAAAYEATDRTPESSSVSGAGNKLPDAPDAVFSRRKERSGMKIEYQTHMLPFSHLAAAVKVGLEGVGVDLATPLSNKWNLRAGVSYLNAGFNASVAAGSAISDYGATLQPGAISVAVRPHFFTASTSLDWYPKYGSFRISPGLTLYNGNRGTAIATVGGGQTIDVGDGTYISDPNNPIRAYVDVGLGRRVAPKLTVGWGNMLPRTGEHFSFPFEMGFQYVGRPKFRLALAGNACDTAGDCGPVNNDPSTQENLLKEQNDINDQIAPLRFYPIVSTGVSYRF